MSWTSETNIKGPAGPPGGLGEAPVDGKTYGRNNAAWNVVVSGGGTASSITVVPAGNISSTNVQAALQELDSEKIVRNPATAMPLVESGSGAVGTSLLYAREDHVHPLVGGGSTTYCQDTAPVGAPAGSTWFETDTGLFYVNYFDGDSTQFVTVISATDPSTYAVRYDMAQTLSAPQQIQARQNINADSSVRYDMAQSLTAAQQTQARSNTGTPNANSLINGDFRINQGGYVSAAVLAAAAYGHDQWKAGASGGDYSFTQLASSTQITIAAGKSLIQPIEDVRVVGGSYVLSWTGTAQARAGVNTLTPVGAYASSPLLIVGQTAGTVMSVEFNSGTLGTVKLESGSVVTPFVVPDYLSELALCQRYWCKLLVSTGVAYSTTNVSMPFAHANMRAAPTVSVPGPVTITDVIAANPVQSSANIVVTFNTADGGDYALGNFTGLTSGRLYLMKQQAGNYIRFSARL